MVKIPKIGKIEPSNEVAVFGWYNVIWALSGGDYLKQKEVLLSPISKALMWLIYDNRRQYDEATTYKSMNK